MLKQNKIAILSQLLVKNLASPRFLLKLICCITFGSASRACCLLKSIAIILPECLLK